MSENVFLEKVKHFFTYFLHTTFFLEKFCRIEFEQNLKDIIMNWHNSSEYINRCPDKTGTINP